MKLNQRCQILRPVHAREGLGWWELWKMCHLKDCDRYSLCKELCCFWVRTGQTQTKKPRWFRTKFYRFLLNKTYLLIYLTALPRTKQKTALSSYLKFLTFIFSLFWIPVIKTERRRNSDLRWNCYEFPQSSLWMHRAKLLKALECLTRVQIYAHRHYCPIRGTLFFGNARERLGRNQISFQDLYSAFTFEQLRPCWKRQHPLLKAKDDTAWSDLCYQLPVRLFLRLGVKSNFGDHLLCGNADQHQGTG